MLKKLIAYDLKRTRPVMTGIVLFTFLLTIIIVITSAFKNKIDCAQQEQLESGLIQTHSENLPPIYFTISNIQTIALLAIPVLATLAAIYMLRYYYKTIYLTQGYLSFTLPAKTTEIVSSKMLVTYIWALIFIIPSIFIGTFGYSVAERIFDPHYEKNSVSAYLPGLVLFALDILFIIFEIFVQIMAFFFCLSIGQLCRKLKLHVTVLSYIGIAIASMILFFYNMQMHQMKRGTWWWDYDDVVCPANIICAIILFIGFYVATIKITNKKLNLE